MHGERLWRPDECRRSSSWKALRQSSGPEARFKAKPCADQPWSPAALDPNRAKNLQRWLAARQRTGVARAEIARPDIDINDAQDVLHPRQVISRGIDRSIEYTRAQ